MVPPDTNRVTIPPELMERAEELAEKKLPKFRVGDQVVTYIYDARTTGTVTRFETGKRRRWPIVVDIDDDGRCTLSFYHDAKVTFETHKSKKPVTRTVESVARISDEQRLLRSPRLVHLIVPPPPEGVDDEVVTSQAAIGREE